MILENTWLQTAFTVWFGVDGAEMFLMVAHCQQREKTTTGSALDNSTIDSRYIKVIYNMIMHTAQPLILRVSCQKGPICHAQAWRLGPFWQDTIDISLIKSQN